MSKLVKNKYTIPALSGMLSAFLYYLAVDNISYRRILFYMILNFVLFLNWFGIIYHFNRKNTDSGGITRLIIFFAILFRVILLFSQPTTSDDVYRYLWEGKLVLNGYNPFEYPPDSEELVRLHTEKLPALVTYPSMTTIYPPVAQVIFAAGYLISGESDFGLKLIYLLFDLFTILLLIKLLRHRKLPEWYLIIYAWLPLTIMEYFINSHIDVVGIFFLVLLLYSLETGRVRLSSLAFALGVLVKLYPILLGPLILKKLGWRESIKYFGIAGVIIVLAFIPFIPQDRTIASSFSTYMGNWSFYGSVYKVMAGFFGNDYGRIFSSLLLVVTVLFISYKSRDLIRATYNISLSHVIFVATLFPWYLGYLAVTFVFTRKLSIFWLFFAINLTNFTPLLKPWQEYALIAWLIYLPFYILLVGETKFMRDIYSRFTSKRKRKG